MSALVFDVFDSWCSKDLDLLLGHKKRWFFFEAFILGGYATWLV